MLHVRTDVGVDLAEFDSELPNLDVARITVNRLRLVDAAAHAVAVGIVPAFRRFRWQVDDVTGVDQEPERREEHECKRIQHCT